MFCTLRDKLLSNQLYIYIAVGLVLFIEVTRIFSTLVLNDFLEMKIFTYEVFLDILIVIILLYSILYIYFKCAALKKLLHENEELHASILQKDEEIIYKKYLFENASAYLHNIGNILSMLQGKTLQLRYLKQALSKTSIGIDKLATLFESSQASLGEKEEIQRYLSDFKEGLTEDISLELQETLEAIDGINTEARINIKHQQDLFKNKRSNINYIEQFDLVEMFKELIENHRVLYQKQGASIQLISASRVNLRSMRFQLYNGFNNILKNALESILMHPNIEKPKVLVSIKIQDSKVIIEIEDNGVGVSEENLDKFQDAGFTTKKDGHGLGLHSFYNFLTNNNGSLRLMSAGHLQGAKLYIEIGSVHE